MPQLPDRRRLILARRMATRTRTGTACAPCKARKSKCTDYRPCARCRNLEPDRCVDQAVEISTNQTTLQTILPKQTYKNSLISASFAEHISPWCDIGQTNVPCWSQHEELRAFLHSNLIKGSNEYEFAHKQASLTASFQLQDVEQKASKCSSHVTNTSTIRIDLRFNCSTHSSSCHLNPPTILTLGAAHRHVLRLCRRRRHRRRRFSRRPQLRFGFRSRSAERPEPLARHRPGKHQNTRALRRLPVSVDPWRRRSAGFPPALCGRIMRLDARMGLGGGRRARAGRPVQGGLGQLGGAGPGA